MERMRNFARVGKRVLVAVLVLIALLALVSCGGEDTEKTIGRIYEEAVPSVVLIKIFAKGESEVDGSLKSVHGRLCIVSGEIRIPALITFHIQLSQTGTDAHEFLQPLGG